MACEYLNGRAIHLENLKITSLFQLPVGPPEYEDTYDAIVASLSQSNNMTIVDHRGRDDLEPNPEGENLCLNKGIVGICSYHTFTIIDPRQGLSLPHCPIDKKNKKNRKESCRKREEKTERGKLFFTLMSIRQLFHPEAQYVFSNFMLLYSPAVRE